MADTMAPFEAEIDAVIAEFKGDHRAAILVRDGAAAISRGYVRGRWPAHGPVSPDGAVRGIVSKRADDR